MQVGEESWVCFKVRNFFFVFLLLLFFNKNYALSCIKNKHLDYFTLPLSPYWAPSYFGSILIEILRSKFGISFGFGFFFFLFKQQSESKCLSI